MKAKLLAWLRDYRQRAYFWPSLALAIWLLALLAIAGWRYALVAIISAALGGWFALMAAEDVLENP